MDVLVTTTTAVHRGKVIQRGRHFTTYALCSSSKCRGRCLRQSKDVTLSILSCLEGLTPLCFCSNTNRIIVPSKPIQK
jgi:hypothetical protein